MGEYWGTFVLKNVLNCGVEGSSVPKPFNAFGTTKTGSRKKANHSSRTQTINFKFHSERNIFLLYMKRESCGRDI